MLTVRRLEPRMGLENLLHAMKRICSARDDVLLAVAGRGSLRGELHSLAASLGIESRVRWLGFVPEAELPSLYRAADVFVLPTRTLEGFGLVTLESLACGVPVLGTDVGATAEILGPLEPDLLIPTVGPEDIAASVLRFFDRQDGEKLAARCRAFVLERYRWPILIEKYERLFSELT